MMFLRSFFLNPPAYIQHGLSLTHNTIHPAPAPTNPPKNRGSFRIGIKLNPFWTVKLALGCGRERGGGGFLPGKRYWGTGGGRPAGGTDRIEYQKE